MRRRDRVKVVHLAQLLGQRFLGHQIADSPSCHRIRLSHGRYRHRPLHRAGQRCDADVAGIFKSSKTMENFKVVAKWHEFVLAPKEDRDRLEAHEARIEAKKKESARITKAQDEKLVSEAMQKVGAYLMAAHDVDESDRIHLKPALNHPGAVREAASFDNGNVPRKLERKK